LISNRDEIRILKSLVIKGGIILKSLRELASNVPKISDLPLDKVQASSTAHTLLDDVVQEVILQNLYEIDPDVKINVEELTPRVEWFKNSSNSLCFHLDPLDGTLAYVQQRDDYSIGAGFTRNNEFSSSVIYIPHSSRIYSAQKGKGITLENDLGQIIPFKRKIEPENFFIQKRCEDFIPVVKKLNLQSLDLKSAHHTMLAIAEGRAKLQMYNLASVHDFGISKLFVEEAGGICTDLYGNAIKFDDKFSRVPYFFSFFDKKIKIDFFSFLKDLKMLTGN
jgi:fructose-1,6-bisphosphatase/inositol monophosphatase family enzyme